jgi:hypothetical protein
MKLDKEEIKAIEEGIVKGLKKIIPGVGVKIILPKDYYGKE